MGNMPLAEKYFIALHWSVTQFQGTTEVFPQTLGERVFAVITPMLAILLLTSVVSFTVGRLQDGVTSRHKLRNAQARALRAFSLRYQIKAKDTMDIRKVIAHIADAQEEREQEITLLSLL